MLSLSASRYRAALVALIAFHIFIIILSNYLVQFPIDLLGWKSTWGAFSFPFIFLATDLTVRLIGKKAARRVISWVMLPALAISYVISALFHEGHWQGFSTLAEVNVFILRISAASFAAYVVGQIADIHVFHRLRQLKQWWVAPTCSTLLGNLLDTFVFFFVAFWHSDNAFMAAHWVEIAWVDYVIKILISLVFFIPLYGALLKALLRIMKVRQKQQLAAQG